MIKISSKNFLLLLAASALFIATYLAIQNRQLQRQTQNELASRNDTGQTALQSSSKPGPTATPAPLIRVPVGSAAGWREVVYKGVTFRIPSEAYCFKDDCGNITVPPYSVIHLSVLDYTGRSRRTYFPVDAACRPIYVDSIFGSVKALQIAIDGGECQGGGGGVVAVIGEKVVSVGYLAYNSTTKTIYRWSVLDTLVSTLK